MEEDTALRPPQEDMIRARSSRLTWGRLSFAAAVVATVVMALVAAVLGDVEAAVVALVFGLSALLLRGRRTMLGAILLILVSAVTFFFMAAAAITNVRSGSPLGAVGISSGLAAMSVVALVASSTVLAGRAEVARGTWMPVAVAGMGFITLPILAASVEASDPDTADVALVAENFAFSDTEIVVPEGPVTVSLANTDLFWHTFTIPELDVDLLVPVGADLAVTFTALEGVYEFICRIPGHPEVGMVGTLVVGG